MSATLLTDRLLTGALLTGTLQTGIPTDQEVPSGARLLEHGTARILQGVPARDLDEHLRRYGRIESGSSRVLMTQLEEAGLRGRGGAGFPTHLKMKAVLDHSRGRLRRRAPVVVANGTESEPASAKDKTLLRSAPHLVVDGLVVAAEALGAARGVLCVDRRDAVSATALRAALIQRAGRDPIDIEIAAVPARYVAGEETALVSWINGGESRPTFSPPRPVERGVSGAPTLVDNVETLANVALIARFGALAYRQVGTPDEPGTMLVTVRGGVDRPGVYEIPIGSPLGGLLSQTGSREAAGVLVGGYFGSWLTPAEAFGARMSRAGLNSVGASPGCGILAVMPRGQCPLQEVSAVLGWLASNSAGQCGACVNGLPALAAAFEEVASGNRSPAADERIDRWTPMVAGRGGCKLPDGAVSFLLSARRVFADHVEHHRRYGPCPPNHTAILPTPALDGWR